MARERLGLPEGTQDWLDRLGPPTDALVPADPAAADAQLRQLGVPDLDRTEMLAARPAGDLVGLLARAHRQLVAGIGGIDPMPDWPDLGEEHRYFYPWLLLSALPAVRDYHHDRRISDEVSWATLRDLGRQLARSRRVLGRGGLTSPGWLTLHFRGALYQLGRLQFQRVRVPVERAQAVLPDAAADVPALNVHIPAAGPLTPERCDESFATARRFFADHFPEDGYRFAICSSWLLDEQLAGYLPADANIVAFQRRFQPVPGEQPTQDDLGALGFVFDRRQAPLRAGDLDELPQDTTLQRALVAHLRAGRHWHFRTGWCEL